MLTPLNPQARATRLEVLRTEYMGQIAAAAIRQGRPLCVVPYVLAQPGAERHADLGLITSYATRMGWQVAFSSFADIGQPLPLTRRPGFTAACRYAAQGYAHGVLAIARAALTTDDDSYARVLEHLRERQVFLAHLPTLREHTP
ncbi:hypothetical protein [Streptomyces sp. NRRL S-1022]|uniref:hypothetical protein n=1 Tax=Streptomyces sp. NRRL S-1022 TaxID=1463880 RepID=UPI0004C1F90D|nr:hypothetical protein [Streptomyces sp. NRRL S-1022]